MKVIEWLFIALIDLVVAYLYTLASGGGVLVFVIAAILAPILFCLMQLFIGFENLHRMDRGLAPIPILKLGIFWVVALALFSPIFFNGLSYVLEYNNFGAVASVLSSLKFPSIIIIGIVSFLAIYGLPPEKEKSETPANTYPQYR